MAPPFAGEGDGVEIGDTIRRGDVGWFERVAPAELVMRVVLGAVNGPRYRIDRGTEPDVLRLGRRGIVHYSLWPGKQASVLCRSRL